MNSSVRELFIQDLPLLNRDERALFDDLRDQHTGPNLRLEQMRKPYTLVINKLAELIGVTAPLCAPAQLPSPRV